MRPSVVVLRATIVWLLLALVLGASGLLREARPPLPQLMIAALAAMVLVLYWTPTAFRRWARVVDPRALVLFHLTRFVGIYFLVLYGRGELPYAFAVPGGWGDIAVAVTALGVCLFGRPGTPGRCGVLFAWNAFGFLDILMVVATAARLWRASPDSMGALARLPLSLLPTFVVPIIIASHVIIFERLVRRTA